MEAQLIEYDSAAIYGAAGQIAVTATKEEWQDVITFMTNCPYWPPVSVPAIEFVDQLEERGVEAH